MKACLSVLLLCLCLFGAKAQNKEKSDSLVRLISARKMEQVEKDGQSYRKVTGPARFLHNDTYLLCDTAVWNMNTSVIDCIGHVSIIQEDTRVTSDKLTYLIDNNLAQFRGSLVELEDKEGNRLRTRHLDYNTKDSLAVFSNGGSMKDHTGQIIESQTGRYESKIKLFTFLVDVNMFTDSIFIKTSNLLYHSQTNLAEFSGGLDAWKDKSLLSSEEGWYDRGRELFFFRKKVHAQNETQEAWSDSLFFNRALLEVELLGNAQVSDTTRNAHAMAGRMFYQDTLSTLTLTRDPVIVGIDNREKPDTAWTRADKYIYRTVPRCEVDSSEVVASRNRLNDLAMDPVAEYRRKAAEAAAAKAAEAAKKDPNNPANRPVRGGKGDAVAAPAPDAAPARSEAPKAPSDTVLQTPADTLQAPADTLQAPADTLQSPAASVDSTAQVAAAAPPKDSTKISFLTAIGNIKVYKSDLQVASDSLEYSAIDSLVRMYKRPIVWNSADRQYTSDSLFAVIRGQTLQKASLMSEAFVTFREDSLCFDQIRSTEMMAYFDSTGAISRYDALGDADAIFYIKEDSTFATINMSKSKMLSATFKDGEIDMVHYYDASKSDAYPLAQVKKEQRSLKGFEWSPEKRPAGRGDITDKKLRESQRKIYNSRPQPLFRHTDDYFPGYIAGVKDEIAANEAARERRRLENAERERISDSLARAQKDSLIRDSLAVEKLKVAAVDSIKAGADSLKAGSDSLKAPADSLKAPADSLTAQADTVSAKPLTEAERKAIEKEARRKEKEALAKAKAEAREREWARLDSLDAVKAAEKAAVKLRRQREKKRKLYLKMLEEERREKKILDKYIEYYRRKKAAEEAAVKEKQEEK